MKRGRIAVLDKHRDRELAALIDDGRLVELLIDPPETALPLPEAIYRAKVNRPLKGQGGLTVDLGNGQSGFLRQAKGLSQGDSLLVQVSSQPGEGKAAPVTARLLFKSRYAIVTPGAKGLNIAKRIRSEDERDRLSNLATRVMSGADTNMGLILRSCAENVDDETLEDDILAMRELAEAVQADVAGSPELLVGPPSARSMAWREWTNPLPDDILDDHGSFETLGVWDMVSTLRYAATPLPTGGSIVIERTSAMITVDVNTGSDTSILAGSAANFATAQVLATQLRLRGYGGQIVVDFAPMSKKDRRGVEQTLLTAFRKDGADVTLVGWTALGHFELQRKRDRLPLNEVLLNGLPDL